MEKNNLDTSIFSESKCNILNQLLHACADEICGYPGPNYEHFNKSMEWNQEEYNNSYHIITSLLQNPTCLYLDEERMPLEYHALPEQVQQRILKCLKVRREQLTDALLKKTSRNTLPTFRDFDWRLKLIMGSSKMASLREPLLQLDLIVEEKDNERLLSIELNKDELDIMIHALESEVKRH
ncbi:COMM domain-containing protein 8-like [Leptopilina heterotoma]|uniref:COMM domain-containing protein 8-like n=1 Tax=Leptopilina heterotoma TaxID=63436 RepID=UPI001CA91F29|nr:COMM domain-containing protein 8-like [Leptopilina heterotoma]XP_043480207.1 COMM domain-containing protein 8-like [Leptopilina heterotoma]